MVQEIRILEGEDLVQYDTDKKKQHISNDNDDFDDDIRLIPLILTKRQKHRRQYYFPSLPPLLLGISGVSGVLLR